MQGYKYPTRKCFEHIHSSFFLLAPFTWRVIAKSKHKQSPRKRRLARTIDYDFCLSHFGGPCGRRQWMWDRQWSGHPVGPGICCRGLSTATENWTFRSQLEGQSAGPLRCPLAPRHHQLGATGPARDRWRPHRPETGRRDLAATTSFNSGRFVWLSDHLNWKVFTGAVGGGDGGALTCLNTNGPDYVVCLLKQAAAGQESRIRQERGFSTGK